MRPTRLLVTAVPLLVVAATARGQTLTMTSPAGGTLPAGVTPVGGIVVDLRGNNNNHVISQIPASSLYEGFANDGTPVAWRGNPLTVGVQGGWGPAQLGALGGGLSAAAFRFSLYDGDQSPGNFDYNQNTLTVNGSAFTGNNWSSVTTQQTTSAGVPIGGTSQGFANNQLHTGWFSTTEASFLSALFASLSSSGQLSFQLIDVDPYDNFYDFTQGIDASLINVGTPPVVTPPGCIGAQCPPNVVPEPATLALLGTGLVGLAGVQRRRKKTS